MADSSLYPVPRPNVLRGYVKVLPGELRKNHSRPASGLRFRVPMSIHVLARLFRDTLCCQKEVVFLRGKLLVIVHLLHEMRFGCLMVTRVVC